MSITPINFAKWRIDYGDDVELVTKINGFQNDLDNFVDELNVEIAGSTIDDDTGEQIPATPLNPIVDSITATSARLRWTRPDETNIARYLLYRQALPSGLPVLVDTIQPDSSYIFSGLAGSTNYQFEVIPQSASGTNGVGAARAATTSAPGGGAGRASDSYAQNLETPIINRLERKDGSVRFYYGPSQSNNYPSGTDYEFEVGGQVFGPDPDGGGYFAIPDAPSGGTGRLRAVHVSQQRRSADAQKSITVI